MEALRSSESSQTIYQFLLPREQFSDQTASEEFQDTKQNILFRLKLRVWHSIKVYVYYFINSYVYCN